MPSLENKSRLAPKEGLNGEWYMPELVVTPKGNYAESVSSDDMLFNLEQAQYAANARNSKLKTNMQQSMNNRIHPFFTNVLPLAAAPMSLGSISTGINVAKNVVIPFAKKTLPHLAIGMLGGKAVDEGMKDIYGYDWGEGINLLSQGYIPSWLGEFTNPGYAASSLAKPLASGINYVTNNIHKTKVGRVINDMYRINDHNIHSRLDRLHRSQYDEKNPYYQYYMSLGKEQIDKAKKSYRRYVNNYSKFRYIDNTVDDNVRHARPNIGKMSEQNMLKYLQKQGVSNPEEFRLSYDPITGTFRKSYDTYSFVGFDPNRFVHTGEITMRDLRTGIPSRFTINIGNPSRIHSSKVISYNPSGPNPYAREVIEETSPEIIPSNLSLKVPKEYTDFLSQNSDYVTNTLLPGSKIFGSTSNITRGNLAHGSHDLDVIMTEAGMKRNPNFKNFTELRQGATWQWHYPNSSSPIDINIIREKNGKAYGQLAHELYSQLFPARYRSYMGTRTSVDVEQPLNISAQELLDAYDPVVKGITDAFASNKSKHVGRSIYYLHYGNIDDVEKGFYNYANYILGGRYKPTEIPLSEFSNPQTNSEIIDQLGLKGINKESFINDPRRMKLLFDYSIFDKSFVGRGVPDSKNFLKSLTYWYPTNNGGSAMGVGLNTVLGGNSGYGSVYGIIQPNRMLQITEKTPKGVLKQIQSTSSELPLSSSDVDKINKLINKHNLDINSNGITTFRDLLEKTSSKEGNNYKEFLSDLAQEFNIPYITSSHYGNAPYASLLEDQPYENVVQLIPHSLDRPVPASFRDGIAFTSEKSIDPAMQSFLDDIHKVRRRQLLGVSSKENPDSYSRGMRALAKEKSDKKYGELKDLEDKFLNIRMKVNTRNDNWINNIYQKKYKYDKRLNRLSNLNNILGVGTAGGTIVGTLKHNIEKSNNKKYERRLEKARVEKLRKRLEQQEKEKAER